MVFENLAVYFVNKYLGNYIENLDAKNLKIELWNGKIILENLYLKSNALDHSNIPMTVSVGYLKKLTFEFPWRYLYTHPTKATIHGLFLRLVPKIDVEFDSEKNEKEEYEFKMKEVRKVENIEYTKTFIQRIQLEIFKNFQLSIENIHIIYQDKLTKPDHPFACGIYINYIALRTTTPQGEDTSLLHKHIELNSLSIYWNSNVKSLSDSSRNNNNLKEIIPINDDQISYLLQPINVKVILLLTMKPYEQDFKRSMFDIKIDLDDHINLNINRHQYLDIFDLLEFQNSLNLRSKYLKYHLKPNKEQKFSLKNWKFAYEAIVNEYIRPRFESYKWENIKTHLKQSREYHSLHFQQLTGNKLTNQQKHRVQELEMKLDVFNLIYIRRSAQIKATKKLNEQSKTWWATVSNWWNRKPEKAISYEEKTKFYQSIQDISTRIYPEEYVDINLSIRLNILNINLWSKISQNDEKLRILTHLVLSDIDLTLKRRPARNAINLFIDFDSFKIFGISNDLEENQLRPILGQSNHKKFFQIQFETNPLNSKYDYYLQIVSQFLQIKYHHTTISKLVRFFSIDSQKNVKQIKENFRKIHISIHLYSSYLILPENGISKEDAATISIDFNHFILEGNTNKSCYLKKSFPSKYLSLKEFQLKFKDIQFIYDNPKEQISHLVLIKPINFQINIDQYISNDHSHLPVWKIDGNIPSIEFHLSDKHLIQIINHIKSIPTLQRETNLNNPKQTEDQLEMLFTIDKINFYIDEFIHVELVSIFIKTIIKTSNIKFDASLGDLIVYHQLFPLLLSQHQFIEQDQKLITMQFVNTSSDYRIYLYFTKLVFNLQQQSILSFQNTLFKTFETNTSHQQLKISEDNKQSQKIIQENDLPVTRTLKIITHFEELWIKIASKETELFHIQIEDIKVDISQTSQKSLVNLILSDIRVFDPYEDARYRKIIYQEDNDNKELLHVDLCLHNSPDVYEKAIDVNVEFAKTNIVFLFKHIDAILNLIHSFNINKASVEFDPVNEQIERSFKIHYDIILNGLNIIVPMNFYSKEGILFDLGKLTLKTRFYDDPTKCIVEQENIVVSRIEVNEENNIIGEIILIETSQLNLLINRFSYSEKGISIKVKWNLIHFQLTKDDYLCFIKLFMENQIPPSFQNKQEDLKSQKEEIVRVLKFRLEIKKLLLTFYLGESDLTVRRASRNENFKLGNIEIEMIETLFRRQSDSSYKAMIRFQDFLLDDLRQTNVTHIISRYITVDSNPHLVILDFEYKPSNSKSLMNVQVESVYIYLLTYYQKTTKLNHQHSIKIENTSSSVETTIDIILKNPQIVLLEDQQNSNSNSLNLRLTLQMRMINLGEETKLYGWLTDLSICYSKMKYSFYKILEVPKADVFIIMDNHQEKVDGSISNINLIIIPTAVRTLIAVATSFTTYKTTIKDEKETIDSQSLFYPRPFKDKNFWFIEDTKLETNDILETIPKEQKFLFQHFILRLETIEIKFENLFRQSLIEICLSNLNANLKNWSSNLSLSSTINIQAALFNERIYAWEPLIEPTINQDGTIISPSCITCSILPILSECESNEEDMSLSSFKQIILIRFDQLLNITITKTGIDVIQHLSSLFDEIYNKRLEFYDDDHQSMLSLFNSTGRDLFIHHLNSVQENCSLTSINLKENECIPLIIPNEHQRRSLNEEQDYKTRQTFSITIENVTKNIRMDRTSNRVYNFSPSFSIKMLCDTQIINHHRHIILRSILKICNNTNIPLIILTMNSNKYEKFSKINLNEEYNVPIDLLSNSNIFLAIDENDNNDLFSFDWENEFSKEIKLKLTNGKQADFIISKELIEVYQENTDEVDQTCFNIYISPSIHLTNLLPIDIQCSIDNDEEIDLKSSELNLITSGNKHSTLIFTIPSYDNIKWISKPIDLQDDQNERLVIFHDITPADPQQILRMVLRIDTYHESYRLLLYSPFWIINRTELQLQFQIENNSTFIQITQTPFLICPEKFDSNTNKKTQGQIRLYGSEQNDNLTSWSQKFSLDVIKSTGMASCKDPNDRIYMICVEIVTCSFGLTKLITLYPSIVIINKSTIEIEVVETVLDKWESINPEQIIPFWSHNIQDGLMRVRYKHNRVTSTPFMINEKHRTLLRMNDEQRPAIYVEVSSTDFDGITIIFNDYKIGDAPLLIVNSLKNDSISFSQVNHRETQILPSQNSVYYTWFDPLKPRELVISYRSKTVQLEINSQCGLVGKDSDNNVNYTIFLDGVQTVLLFSDDIKMIEAASGVSLLTESIGQRIQIGIYDVGLSIVNDITREEIFYISLNKSKVLWTETQRSRIRPLSNDINTQLEEIYKTHIEECESHPENKDLQKQKYHMDGYREISFDGNTAELVNQKGQKKLIKRQSLDGLWIEYTYSGRHIGLHIRINRVQIDNQIDYTIYPVVLYPIISKTRGIDLAEKPFIELSIYQTKTTRSNIIQFKYFKLLIQEFTLHIDQRLIISILTFLRQEKNSTSPTINMDTDLKQIEKSLIDIIREQTDSPIDEREMYFDNIHLSPLKIHISFTMHGLKPNEIEYPLVGFLLRTLNVAEVQDVILRLGYYERTDDRYTVTKLTNEVSSHYQNQFLKQLHVLIFGLDVLGNPVGVIRGLFGGVQSFFYEPYKGIIEGPMEFAEGVATGVRTLFGSTIGGAAGAVSKITGVLGKGLATLTFDEDYKTSRLRRKEITTSATNDIALGGKNVVMSFVDGVTGIVTKPISGAKQDGASGFIKGLGKGFIGLVTRPTGGIVDFASTSLDLIKRTANQEEVVRRVRYPRYISSDGLLRSYIDHEAIGFHILNRLEERKYAKTDNYIAHIICSESPPYWLMATSKRILFITEILFIDAYRMDWQIQYKDLKDQPVINTDLRIIQFLTKIPKNTETSKTTSFYGKIVKYRNISEAQYIVHKIINAMHIDNL